MPRIFDNIDVSLLPTLRSAIEHCVRADFCVGYFNLRGWQQLDEWVEPWQGGAESCCRIMVGMQRLPDEELRAFQRVRRHDEEMDLQTAARLKKRLAEEFHRQLTYGAPTQADEKGLRRLKGQLRAGKVVVKLFLRHTLHAKLYLLHRGDAFNPIIGFLGSSNLTLSGLSHQGELNIEVEGKDDNARLSKWFDDRWEDRWCLDISSDLIRAIDESWAREQLTPPYHVYLKIAYHLSQEARAGLNEFQVPADVGAVLLDFQKAAVQIAARHIQKRGGVLLGDVVGLGKTLMATALVRLFEELYEWSTLIVCPRNLMTLWQSHVDEYGLRARVMSLNAVTRDLHHLSARYRLVVIDESHNLRNREGKRYRALLNYITQAESRVILLSATPYNKSYLDLSSQLRLFIQEERDLGIRPDRLIREMGEEAFKQQHQCPLRSLSAFEQSPFSDDWRELMRRYMVRRTRSFIQTHYTKEDPATGRRFLTFRDGQRAWFPTRIPRTLRFTLDEQDPSDSYARLYAPEVVDLLNALKLPRYGLGNYQLKTLLQPLSEREIKLLRDLSRAGARLMGFCRTNLFKRLESSGHAFVQSVERHVLRNYIYIHAIEQGKDLPLGTLDAALLEGQDQDETLYTVLANELALEDDDGVDDELEDGSEAPSDALNSAAGEDAAESTEAFLAGLEAPEKFQPGRGSLEQSFRRRAAAIYAIYARDYARRFKWLRPDLFNRELAKHLRFDSLALLSLLESTGGWSSARDAKLNVLTDLLTKAHPRDKVLVFTQFADTARYLETELLKRGVQQLAAATGDSEDPTTLAWQFSPLSNRKQAKVPQTSELRVLIATDVLSEGQNLQDAAIVVNYDLPWAIIRLIQRAGRVDRIGQQATEILCYSFLPADGVERLLRLRDRVRQRLKENAEVVGTDEAFFEDEGSERILLDLYHEKAGILDDEDGEVDLASYAWQIWENAVERDPRLEQLIPALPPVSYATRSHPNKAFSPPGALVYMRSSEAVDALAWIDEQGRSVTESQFAILRAAACTPETSPLPPADHHHDLVRQALEKVTGEERTLGGQLGRPSSPRYRLYERLKVYEEGLRNTLFESKELTQVLDTLYQHPLHPTTADLLNRTLRQGITDKKLAELILSLQNEERLCQAQGDDETQEPRIVCSMGLVGS